MPNLDTTPPQLAGGSPVNGSTTTDLKANIVLSFDEAIKAGSGTISLLTSTGSVVETFDVATSARLHIEGNTLVIDPTADLSGGTTYAIQIGSSAITDLVGNAYVPTTQYSFTAASVGAGGSGGISHGIVIHGANGGDSIEGTGGDDTIYCGDGNDTILASAGNDSIDGGAGVDTLVFSGAKAQYTITATTNGYTVTGPAGTDTLVNVERLQFSDAKVALDIHGDAGMAYRLYQAAFDRTPDVGGLGYHMQHLDQGLTLSDIAAQFLASPEFQSKYGGLDNTQFITQLYANVLHRGPDSGGLAFHLDELAHGQTRADMLTHFSESPENQANVIGSISTGMVYTVS